MDDLIHVCSAKRLGDPIHQRGMELKKQWLLKMLRKYGSIAKIAYLNDKPVAQILFYPEEAETAKASKREGVLFVACIYNPVPEAQKLGIATKLLQGVIEDARERKSCLGNKPCKFILTRAFNTGEFLPMSDFYKKNRFLPAPEGDTFYLPLEDNYEPVPQVGEYEPLPEDRNRAIIFYSSACQFSYPFAKRTEELVREVVPTIKIELINESEKPEESIKRKNQWLIVNAKPIKTFFMETEKFKQEIRQALSENPQN